MKNKNVISPKMLLAVMIFCLVCLTNCSSPPKKYFFPCNQQNPNIIQTYIPQVLIELGYETKKNDTIPNSFIATKRIISRNFSKGIENEYVQMRINFKFDTTQSFLTQHYVKEFNGKKKISVLNEEQIKKFEPDANLFLERMFFYCNPQFQGR